MRLQISFLILISPAYSADFTTYIDGANPAQSISTASLATDAAGNTYVTGTLANESGGSPMYVFVTKLGATGNTVSSISFGGQCCSTGNAIAVDPAGNIWVGGTTFSPNFPLVNALQSSMFPPTPGEGAGSGFLVKMSPNGTILYSSYFGRILGVTSVNAIALDQSGNVYVTGSTDASDFPTTPGLPASPVNANRSPRVDGLFVTKLNATGQQIIYSTVIAGTALDCSSGPCEVPSAAGSGIAVDAAGEAFVAGNSDVSDLPVTSGGPPGSGAFALKINAAGNELVYLIYIGPPVGLTSHDILASTTMGGRPIAVDASGNAYLAGYTSSPNFPVTPGAYQTTFILNNAVGDADAFAMKLDPAGATVWATFLGGTYGSAAHAVAIDGSANVWLTGTSGTTIPNTAANPRLMPQTYVAELSADGSALQYIAPFSQGGAGQDIALDSGGLAHVMGTYLVSTITPGSSSAAHILSIVNAAPGTFPDYTDRLNGLIAPGEIISIYGSGMGPATPVVASPQNGFFPTSLGGVRVLVNGTAIPLLYVSATQINAQIPSPLKGVENGLAVVQVMNNSMALPVFRSVVAISVFGVFENPLSGSLAVINQNGTHNSPTNPAKAGSYVSIYGTGFGSVPSMAMDGAVATAANDYCSSCQVTIISYGLNDVETVQYFGPSPGQIDGLTQINFMIPAQPKSLSNAVQVYFTAPGYTQPQLLGFVQVSQ